MNVGSSHYLDYQNWSILIMFYFFHSIILRFFRYRQQLNAKIFLRFQYIYMKTIQLVLLALLIASILCHKDKSRNRTLVPNADTPYTGLFAATWLRGYCYNTTKCDNISIHNWDKQSFTIHGFWPSPKSDISYTQFNETYIKDQVLLDDMNNYFPHNSKPTNRSREYFLWKHEYSDHGVDYSRIMQHLNPHKYAKASTQTLQQAYFREVIRIYKSFKLQKIDLSRARLRPNSRGQDGNPQVTKDQLAQIIDLDPDKFVVSCYSKWLAEIKICMRIHYDLSTSLERCEQVQKHTPYKVNDNSCNGKPFKLIRYKNDAAPSQERVTARTAQRGRRQERETIDQQL